MKPMLVVILGVLWCGSVWAAGPDPREAQIEAATGDAVMRLRFDIEVTPLSPQITVADFVRATGSSGQLAQTLRSADQIGGPRWVDGETCQVKLAIGSERVRQTLTKIATDNARISPVPAESLTASLRVWNNRTFTATGTSISAKRAEQLRPGDSGPWRSVPDEARRQAIVAARDNAAERVLDSLRSIEISGGQSLSTLLIDKNVSDPMRQWMAARPVTRLEFNSDLSIEITVAAEPRDVFDALCAAAGEQETFTKDPLKLAKVRREIDLQMAPAIGAARAAGRGNRDGGAIALIPRKPPAWTAEALKIESTAKFQGSRLKTARSAEETAREQLRGKVDALELSTATLGETAKRDPAVERAVQQAMGRARAESIEYLPDGSARVQVMLDARDLWDRLCELP